MLFFVVQYNTEEIICQEQRGTTSKSGDDLKVNQEGRLDASPLGFDAFLIVALPSSLVSARLSDLEGLFYRPILRLSILSPLRMPFRYLGQFIPCLLDTKVACRR